MMMMMMMMMMMNIHSRFKILSRRFRRHRFSSSDYGYKYDLGFHVDSFIL
jgi:hypothetical protein